MGQVYLGRSPGGRPVAVKLVRPEFGDDAGFRRRFATEVEAARRVGGFYTAQVVDADPDAERPWLVTAYVPGPSLREAVVEHGPLPVRTVRVLAGGLAEGLAAVHACGLVHRDLKPGNVILASDGPRLIDFGIARAMEGTSLTATGAVVGTPAFMSPEQALGGDELGPASDVFSLGSVLVFASTGSGPYGHGPTTAVLYRIARENPDLAAVPAELREPVAACLAKDPAARPPLAEVLRWFADAGDGAGSWLPPPVAAMVSDLDSVPSTPATVPGTPRGGRIGWVLAGAAALLVVATIAVLFVVLRLVDDDTASSSSEPTPSPTSASSSQLVGRIEDDMAGFSYARLGAPWTNASESWTRPGLFTSGQVAPLPQRSNGVTFNAISAASVPLPAETSNYRGPADFPAIANRVKERLLPTLFTVQYTETVLSSGEVSLSGSAKGWLERVRLDFPQADANGWPVKANTLAILVVDHDGKEGGPPPGLLLVSLPDAFSAQGDLEQVLDSVRVT